MSARLHVHLLEAAQRTPDAPAYVGGETTITYGELARAAARFAHGLRERGVSRGDRVAVVLDSCVEYLVGTYGSLMAGAAVVPLNPDTRPNLLRHALGHSGTHTVVIGAAETRHLVPVIDELPDLRHVVVRGTPSADLHRVSTSVFGDLTAGTGAIEDAGASGEDLASVTYTSGTTGPPKGVMLAHRNVVANVRSIVEYLGLGPEDRIAMVLPYYYVYGTSVIYTHVAAGGAIVDAGSIAFPVTVLGAIEAHRCTGISGVPSTFARLLRVGDLGQHDLSSIRYVTQAGAAMSKGLTESLRRALPGARIFVMYGQTEASARLTYLPPERLDDKLGSVGVGIPGVSISVVGPDGEAVPAGSTGEVVARGDNVMLGYLGDPEASARALRGGVLHTSDVGYLDDDGFLFLVGRESEMIKSGGHRIGPHEVEEAIADIPGVAECAVAGVPDELLGQVIVAFVVRTDDGQGAAVDERAVKKACFDRLPRFKMPARVVFVEALARSDRGKILRKEMVASLEERRA